MTLHSQYEIMLHITNSLKVHVVEVKGLKSLANNKIVYCTMEVEGGEKLQTDQAEASKPRSVQGSKLRVINSHLRLKFRFCELN